MSCEAEIKENGNKWERQTTAGMNGEKCKILFNKKDYVEYTHSKTKNPL